MHQRTDHMSASVAYQISLTALTNILPATSQIHGPHGTADILAKLKYFTKLDFPQIRGNQKATFWAPRSVPWHRCTHAPWQSSQLPVPTTREQSDPTGADSQISPPWLTWIWIRILLGWNKTCLVSTKVSIEPPKTSGHDFRAAGNSEIFKAPKPWDAPTSPKKSQRFERVTFPLLLGFFSESFGALWNCMFAGPIPPSSSPKNHASIDSMIILKK